VQLCEKKSVFPVVKKKINHGVTGVECSTELKESLCATL
jgi:hypothetical protein